MKHLKADVPDSRHTERPAPRKMAAAAAPVDRKTRQKPKKKKKRKGLAHRFFDEAFDLFDDIFD